MNNKKIIFSCVFLVIAISGCSILPAYKEPTDGQRGRVRFQGMGMSMYSYANEKCDDKRQVGAINGFMLDHFTSRGMLPRLMDSIPAIEAWVPAERQFYGSLSKFISGYGVSHHCTAPFSFIPERDADYDIDLEIFDAGNPPKRYCRGVVMKLTTNVGGEIERTPIPLTKFRCPE